MDRKNGRQGGGLRAQNPRSVKVRCLFFASIQDLLGTSECLSEVPQAARVADLLDHLQALHPGLEARRTEFRVAVEGEFVDEDHPLTEGAEVALVPPVSGGGGGLVRLSAEPISVDECLQAVRREDCGAVVLFLGTVRDHAGGRSVRLLEYTAYERMARSSLEDLAAEVRRRFPVGEVALWHRTGALLPGEISVVVAVSSAHREEAFAAARWALDTLKETVPVWKKEFDQDGAVWIEGDLRRPC